MDSLKTEIDTIIEASLDTVISTSNQIVENVTTNESWIITMLESNPGLMNILLTGVILPISILLITNWHTRKSKTLDKELDIKYNSKEDIRQQEKSVYASLSKLLFDVQQLHVELSGSCVDEDCINRAIEKFEKSGTKFHEEIAENMLYLSSKVIDDIYRFYNKMSDLKIRLREFNSSKNFDMAHVLVHYLSRDLATILMDIQDRLLKKRSDDEIEFDRTMQEMMLYCCGHEPPQELKDKYLNLIEQLGLDKNQYWSADEPEVC